MKAWGVVGVVLVLWFLTGLVTAVLFGKIVQMGERGR